MEKYILRTLVLVLAATCLGLYGMAHSKVMLSLPPHQSTTQHVSATNPNPGGGTQGAPAPSGAPVSTGAPASTGVPAPTGTPVQAATGVTGTPPSAPTAPKLKTGTVEDYFISLDQAKKMWDDAKAGKNIVFIDAREYIEYKEGHVAGSMSCPKRRFDGAVPGYVRNNLPGNAVVVYCHGAECTDSEAVVKRLIALNLQIGPFYIIKDGYPGWKDAGYPVNTGDNEGWGS
jgi:rhodanese-related sulfurtransferase